MERSRLRAFAAVAAMLLAGPAAADGIEVVLDQARIQKLPAHVATVVIGNPLIADIAIQQGGQMVVTGKAYGATNFIALDRDGKVLAEHRIEVVGPRDGVVVYRGVERESYSCTPQCERRVVLGDSAGFFDPTLAQASARNAQAVGAAGTRP